MIEHLCDVLGEISQTYGQNGHLKSRRPEEGLLNAQVSALLQALREPTPEMIEAGALQLYGWGDSDRPVIADRTWTAMIDAALHSNTEIR